jgi:uncharacterized protein YcbK (DUF882 family)
MINTKERIELSPLRDDGGFAAEDMVRASHALRDPRTDDECAIAPRLLDLTYQVEQHFHAKAVRVLSAFRKARGRSKHGKGRAVDFVVPGVRDEEVARFARTIGFVGVGLYPRSGFVHLDTRSRSYFWVDGSGPGQRSRMFQVFAKVAAASDANATQRGETPPTDGSESDGDSDHESDARRR